MRSRAASSLIATALYLALLLPWLVLDAGFRPHPRAYRLEFRLASPSRLLGDASLNVAAFVPLGWLRGRGIRDVAASTRSRALIVTGFCAALLAPDRHPDEHLGRAHRRPHRRALGSALTYRRSS